MRESVAASAPVLEHAMSWCVHVGVCVCLCVCSCIHVCLSVCLSVCTYVYMHFGPRLIRRVRVTKYVCMYACRYVFVYAECPIEPYETPKTPF